MSEEQKDALQTVADEARHAARQARELANLLDSYADCLLQPDLQGRASDLHFIALDKLKAMREIIARDEWVERSEKNREL